MLQKMRGVFKGFINRLIKSVRATCLRFKSSKGHRFYFIATLFIIVSMFASMLLPSMTVKAQSRLTWSSNADFYMNKNVLDGQSGACKMNSFSGLAISGDDYSDITCASSGAESDLALARLTAANNLTGITSIVAGDNHSLALKNDGTVWAWGLNTNGQLGDNSTTQRLAPVQVKDTAGTGYLTDIIAIAAGYYHSMSVKNDGTVWAWGNNGSFQLGDNSSTQSLTPIQVKDTAGTGFLTGIKTVAVGAYHSIALKNDGTVWSWGLGDNGELGNGSINTSFTPIQVKDTAGTGFLTGITSIAAGFSHSMAVKNDGTVWAWGVNGEGQLGVNSFVSISTTPIQVKDTAGTGFLTGITSIAAGFSHSMAVKNDGTVWAWGSNFNGQLGDDSYSQSLTPVQVKDTAGTSYLADVISVDGGAQNSHSLALKNDGTVWAWGYNANGQLGDNSQTESLTPVQVKDTAGTGFLTGITAVDNGNGYSLALKNDGTIWAWGVNTNGRLGDNSVAQRLTPFQVVNEVYSSDVLTDLSDVKAIVAGSSHSLAVKNDGTVWSWGLNTNGQLGNSSTTSSSIPVQVKDTNDGTGYLTGITAIAAGISYSMALKNDGTVWSWGLNTNGQLGNGSTTSSSIPVQVKDTNDGTGYLAGITAIAAGSSHSLALKNDGTVWAWGLNTNSRLGDGSTSQRSTPVRVKDASSIGYLGGVTAIAAGGSHSLAIKKYKTNTAGIYVDASNNVLSDQNNVSIRVADDGVWAWGLNSNGQLGNGLTATVSIPVKVKDTAGTGYLADITSVDAGSSHSLALKNDGTVWAWGLTETVGNGSGLPMNTTKPVQISALAGITDISAAAGGAYSIALKNNGTVWAWGWNSNGQLGDGSTTQRLSPVQVKDTAGTGWLTGITTISAGSSHSLAIKNSITADPDEDTAWGWGLNTSGRLGDGSITQRLTPVQTNIFSADSVVYEKLGVLSGVTLDIGAGKKTRGYSINWNSDALPASTSISFSVRTGTDNKTWSDWTSFNQTGAGTTTGAGDLTSLPISRYIEIRAVLATSDALVTPKINDFSLMYMHDIIAPTGPTNVNLFNGTTDLTVTTYKTNGQGEYVDVDNNVLSDQNNIGLRVVIDITQEKFFNYSNPIFKFYGANDPDIINSVAVDQSGINGYYVYFGQDDTAAYTAGTFQSRTDSVPNTFNTLDLQIFTPSTAISNEGDYYLRVATVDNAGNISDPVTLFTYKYDKTPPTAVSSLTVDPFGWSSNNNFTFNWAASTDLLGQGQSGIAGYQYKINDADDDWSGSSQTVGTTLTLSNSNQVHPGTNVLYIRAIDNAGNVSSIIKDINFYYTGNAPSAPLSLIVDPIVPTQANSFTFSWLPPSKADAGAYQGDIIGYRYSINSPVTDTNSVFIKLSDVILGKIPAATYNTTSGQVTLSNIPAATRVMPNANTFYVMAIGTDGSQDIIAYGNESKMAKVEFYCDTSAPGLPTSVQLFDTSNRDTLEYSVTIKWTAPSAENSGIGVSGYDIYRSIDGINFGYPASPIGSSTGTSFVDAGVAGGTTYYYEVRSRDSANNTNGPTMALPISPTGRYTRAPDITNGPAVAAKVSTANIQWTTSTDDTSDQHKASSFVEIGETVIPETTLCKEVYGVSQGQDDHVSDHEVLVTGLKSDSTYYYRVKSTDKDGNKICANGMFRTRPAPRVERVSIQDIRLYTAILTWYTSEPAISDLLYGKSTNYSSELKNISGGATTVHTVRLEGLEDSSTYHFAVRITDIDGNQITSDDYTFETQKYPKISNVRFQPLNDQATAAFQVTWDTNVPTTSVVQFKPDGGTIQETVKTKLETKHTITINGLFDDTYYLMNTIGVDQFGNSAISDTQRIKTAYDTRPPATANVTTEVSNTEFGTAAKSQIVVSWQTDEPSTSQVEYDFGVTGDSYGSKTQEDANLTTSHVVVLTNLRPSSVYRIRTSSKDALGNKGVSEQQSVLTEQARSSVFDIIINSLQSSLGWLFNIGK